jgi:2,4-dienoyl-CoA reductase-like NADH-dependent reductase (Old Yellow Enzyme family)
MTVATGVILVIFDRQRANPRRMGHDAAEEGTHNMPEIFEHTVLAGMELKNRLVRSATWEGLADPGGRVTPELLRIHEDLADGGVGLIISSYMYVQKIGQQSLGQIGVDRDDLVPGLRSLADAVHRKGGKIVAQIVHCGGQSDRRQNGNQVPIAPSAVESPGYPIAPCAMTEDDIHAVIADFAAAARRVQAASFDGVQLHGAHGYLLAQFLSPLRNRRTDRYGGSLENRARFGLEVYLAVRRVVGEDFPVMIKLNANDFLEGSTTENDASFLAESLAEEGIDAIEVSGGTPGSGKLGAARPEIRELADEAYFRPQAEAIRRAVPGVPLMLVGGLRSFEVIEELLANGVADYASMSRPLIREPGLPDRWRGGDRTRAGCISCLGCFAPARRGDGIRCVRAEPITT